jgi:hypothetical protein
MESMLAARVVEAPTSHYIHHRSVEDSQQETTGDALDHDAVQELLTMASQTLCSAADLCGAQTSPAARPLLRRIFDHIAAAQMRRFEREIARMPVSSNNQARLSDKSRPAQSQSRAERALRAQSDRRS